MNHFEQQFIACFEKIAPHYRRFEVFNDFITLSALDMYQLIYKEYADSSLTERFNYAKARYTEPEFNELTKLFALTVEALTEKCYDFLGTVFMQLNLGDEYKGQYFTPSHIADLMAKITLQGCDNVIKAQGFITLSEPTCGSGVMVIGGINALTEAGFNPQQQLWVECRDVDFMAGMMCYIQLSLLHIPASIIIGDTLLNEVKIKIYTLAHFMGSWSKKLEQKREMARTISSGTVDNPQITQQQQSPVDMPPTKLSQSSDAIAELDDDEVIFY